MRCLLIAATLALASPAGAQSLDITINHTRFPSHWYLDKGPRVLYVPPYTPAPEQSSPSLAVPFHAKTNQEAEAEARALARLCAPVRLTTEEGTFYHRPSECR